MMNLRIRSLETKETVRVEVPPECSLQQLKRTLSHALSSSSTSAPPPPESIRLSLNKADEIQSSSPEEDTLQSLGLTSGDLIFYRAVSQSQSQATTTSGEDQVVGPIAVEAQDPEFNLKLAVSDRNPQINPSLMEAESSEKMEIDEGGVEDEGYAMEEDVGKAFSVPGFLHKVFTEELGGDDGGMRRHKLLVIAVHAVLLESGFLGFDMETKNVVTGLLSRDIWPENAFRLSLFYTLPDITEKGCVNGSVPYVSLNFQSIGKYMNIYGSLSSGSALYYVRLDEEEVVSFFNVMLANCGMSDEIVTNEGGLLSTTPEKEVFKFWRLVKDDLALPLLIDFCEKLGFGLPPCFMRLPTELKLKILEHLPGVDVARASCVSSELRYLGSSDDVWMKKFEEQFGVAIKLDEPVSWKQRFGNCWEKQKRRKVNHRVDTLPRRLIYPGWYPLPRRGGPRILYLPERLWADRHRPVFPRHF